MLGSALVWIGIPVGGLWLAGRITQDPNHFLLLALCSIPTSMVLFGWLLYRVNRVYESVRLGSRVTVVSTRSPWLASSSDAHRRDRTQHAKDPHLSDEALEHRTELERQAVGSDDADPAGADEHAATD